MSPHERPDAASSVRAATEAAKRQPAAFAATASRAAAEFGRPWDPACVCPLQARKAASVSARIEACDDIVTAIRRRAARQGPSAPISLRSKVRQFKMALNRYCLPQKDAKWSQQYHRVKFSPCCPRRAPFQPTFNVDRPFYCICRR